MQDTSQTWKDIVATNEFHLESVAFVYGATGDDPNGQDGIDTIGSYKVYATITAPNIDNSILSGNSLSVGNVNSGRLTFTLMTTDTIPKSARITIKGRVTDGNSTSEFISFGTYWVDHRTYKDNLIDIEAYDAMKMGNQAYADNSQTLNWPKPIKTVVTRIAEQMGVDIDSRTMTDIINNSAVGDLEIITKPGDDEVLLDVLSHIGEILGGNWTITPNNELRYVQITTPITIKGYLLDQEENIITTEQGNKLLWKGDEGSDEEEEPVSNDLVSVGVVIGSLTTASGYAVSKVKLVLDSEHVYTVGDDSGYELVVASNNPYANADTVQLLFSRVKGVEYAPFEATNSIYDPAAELGDWVVVGDDISSVLYSENKKLDVGYSANISAPGRDEMEDEYPYRTYEQKQEFLAEQVGKTWTSIQQTQERVTVIAEQYTPKSTIRSTFALDPTNITLSAGVDPDTGEATGQITFNSGTFIVNSNNFSVDQYGHLECNGAVLNGTFTSITETGGADQFKLEADNGLLLSYFNNTLYGMVGLVGPVGIPVYGIAPAGSGASVTLDARRLSDTGEITHNGSYIQVDKNGRIEICGNYIYIRSHPDDLVAETADSGYFYDRDGNTINVLNGMIVGGLRHS